MRLTTPHLITTLTLALTACWLPDDSFDTDEIPDLTGPVRLTASDTTDDPAAPTTTIAPVDSTSTSTSGSSEPTTGDDAACPMSQDCLGQHSAFGACAEDGTCADGLACVVTPTGGVCAPSCSECEDPMVSSCGAVVGAAPTCINDACMVPCETHVDCPIRGMFCSAGGKHCSWLKPPTYSNTCMQPTALFGPCSKGTCGPGLTCLELADRTVCSPPCAACELDAIGACAEGLGLAANRMCSDGLCVVSCDNDDDCHPDATCVAGLCAH